MDAHSFDLGGLEFIGGTSDDPANWIPSDAVAMVKFIDEQGNVIYQAMSTSGVTLGEHIGMVQLLDISVTSFAERGYEGDPDDFDEM